MKTSMIGTLLAVLCAGVCLGQDDPVVQLAEPIVPGNDSPEMPAADTPDTAAPVDAEEAPPADKTGTYMLIPIEGTIGAQFTAKDMTYYLEQARKLKPDIVILYLDTPGGYISDAEEIINAIIDSKDLRFVAYVRKALSAGAAITLTCREIYVEDVAKIGAALCFQTINGLPAPVEEKFQSSWRATCRKAADYGGHPSVLAEAMVDAELAVCMRTEGDKVVVERGVNGTPLSDSGRILTLTAKEAVECRLAVDMVEDFGDLQAKLGYASLTDISSGRKLSDVLAADAEPEADTAAALFNEINKKLDELGVTDEDATELQKTKALETWEEYVEDDLQGRRIEWVVSVLEVEAIDRDSIDQEIEEAQSRIRAYENYVLSGRATSEDKKELRELYEMRKRQIKLLKKTRGLVRDYPYGLVAAAGRGKNNGILMGCVSRKCGELMEGATKGDRLVIKGEIADVGVQIGYDEVYCLVWLQKCAAEKQELARAVPEGASLQAEQDQQQEQIRIEQAEEDAETAAAYCLKVAKMYQSNGNADMARKKYTEIVTKYPDTEAAAEAAEQLKLLGGEEPDSRSGWD